MAADKESKIWALVGKLSAIVTAMVGIVGLYRTCSSPSANLFGTVTWSTMVFPDLLTKSYTDTHQRILPAALTKAAGWTDEQLANKDIRAKVDALTDYLFRNIP